VLWLIVLAAAAVLPYLNSLRNGFVYDDRDQVLLNPYLRNFHYLREILTSSVWSFVGDFRASTNYYRPIMSLGYLACYQLFGPNARGFHAANLLVNLAAVLLVGLVTLKLFGSYGAAFAAAFIFALHPIHSEAVDWIAAVTELELAVFYLLTFWLFLASARPGGKCSGRLQVAMVASFGLALLSKEQALTLPFLAALYEHLFRQDRHQTALRQKLRRYGPLFMLVGLYVGLRVKYLGGFVPSVSRTEFGFKGILISALAFFGWYCWKLLWPVQLCAYYVFPAHLRTLYPWALGGVAALTLCVGAFLLLRKRNEQAAFGVVWILAILAPVLNVRWMPAAPFAERYLYLASVGFCWIAGWAVVEGWNYLSAVARRWRVAVVLGCALLATLCVVRIVRRNRDWHDNVTFYTATLAASPDAYYFHNNLGTEYWEQGKVEAAQKEWMTALRIAPGIEYTWHNLGLLANSKKDYRAAEIFFRRALGIRPNYADAHLDLGVTYKATGRLQLAESEFRIAEKLSPLNIRVHNALSEFCLDQQRPAEAEAEARRSVEINPSFQGYWDLGLAQWLEGKRAETERAFLQAETLNPYDSRTHFMLGLFYMDSNRNADAIREYRAGLKLDPSDPDATANLKKLEFLEAAQ
jgi:tetratricopeptide (TPR) repeat protein